MKKLIIVTLALAFCLPAYAELLIFQTTTTGNQLNVENAGIEKKRERGYLVIDADLSNSDAVVVNEAYHLRYETRDEIKIQYTTFFDPENVELILVNQGAGSSKKMMIRCFDETTGTYTVAFGTATIKDIGGLQRYTASSVSGSAVWRELDFRTGSASFKLRLNMAATKLANTEGKTAEEVLEEYEIALTAKGYNPE